MKIYSIIIIIVITFSYFLPSYIEDNNESKLDNIKLTNNDSIINPTQSAINDIEEYDFNMEINNINFSLSSLNSTNINYLDITHSVYNHENVFGRYEISILKYSNIHIMNFKIDFIYGDNWFLKFSFIGKISVLKATDVRVVRPTSSDTIFNPARYQIVEKSNYNNLEYAFQYFGRKPNTLFIPFIILLDSNISDYNSLLENSELLKAFEYPLGGTFQQTTNELKKTVLGVNIYEISYYSAKILKRFIYTGDEILYKIGYMYIFLYWNRQDMHFNEYSGAVPDYNYWQRISGEIYKPFETVHIRNMGDTVRQFLFCKRILNTTERNFVNQSINWSINYLQKDTVFQAFHNQKTWWAHDIHEGETNKDWILNSHTGTLLTLILANNEGVDINPILIEKGKEILFDTLWDFDMGFNRISYALTYLGEPFSFTEKSDNYELLVALDLIMMFDFLEDSYKDTVRNFVYYVYSRYLDLEFDYIEQLPNKGVLLELSMFLNKENFLNYYGRICWFESYLTNDDLINNTKNYIIYPIFGSNNQVLNITTSICFSSLNISFLDIKKIIILNLTTNNMETYFDEDIQTLYDKLLNGDIILFVFLEENEEQNSLNKGYRLYLVIIFQIILLVIIIGSYIVINKNEKIKNRVIRIKEPIVEKIEEKKRIFDFAKLGVYFAVIIPVFIKIEEYTIALNNVFALFVRRIIQNEAFSKIFLLSILIFLTIYLAIRTIGKYSGEKVSKYIEKIVNSKGISSVLKFGIFISLILVSCTFLSLIQANSISQWNPLAFILYLCQFIFLPIVFLEEFVDSKKDSFYYNTAIIFVFTFSIVKYITFVLDILSLIGIANNNYYSSQNISLKVIILLILVSFTINNKSTHCKLKNEKKIEHYKILTIISILVIVIIYCVLLSYLFSIELIYLDFYSLMSNEFQLSVIIILFLFLILNHFIVNFIENDINVKTFVNICKIIKISVILFLVFSILILLVLYPYLYYSNNILTVILYFISFLSLIVVSIRIVENNTKVFI